MNTPSNNPKVLLTAPVSVHKSYILYEWIRYIKTLDYDNFDILLFDNSPDPITALRISSENVDCVHVEKEFKPIRQIMAECNELSRQYVLDRKYDYLFSLECDIFPPKDIIKKLLEHKKYVVGAQYFVGQFNNMVPMVQVWGNTSFFDDSRSFTFHEGFFHADGTLKKVGAIGLGCVMIHKSVLEKVPFRVDLNDPTGAFPDTFFHVDLMQKNIPVFLDTSIYCEHHNRSWTKVNDKI